MVPLKEGNFVREFQCDQIWTKFRKLAKIFKFHDQILEGMNLQCLNFNAMGQIFIVINGQRLKNNSAVLVTLVELSWWTRVSKNLLLPLLSRLNHGTCVGENKFLSSKFLPTFLCWIITIRKIFFKVIWTNWTISLETVAKVNRLCKLKSREGDLSSQLTIKYKRWGHTDIEQRITKHQQPPSSLGW